MNTKFLPIVLILLGSMPVFAAEQDTAGSPDDEFIEALKAGRFSANLRYRFETVDQVGFLDEAEASTLRSRVGYQSGKFKGWRLFVEFEDVRVIGNSSFNNTKNGKTQFPVVADPDDTELNQFYLDFGFRGKDLLKVGRQRMNINNQRFFGAVGFRQNEQTFDAVRYDFHAGDKISGVFSHINNANRVFGDHHPNRALADTKMSTQLAEVDFNLGAVMLTGFTHFLDFDDNPLASHRNVGIRAKGKAGSDPVVFTWYVEYADQADYQDGATTIDADYWHAKFDVGISGSTFGAGYELLGGDGVYAFQTPLATLHAFNGFADKFLTTPVNGLEDIYVSYKFKMNKFSAGIIYHDYSADFGDANYGDEIDVYFGYQVDKQLGLNLKYADYSADTFSTDTEKVWLSATYRFN